MRQYMRGHYVTFSCFATSSVSCNLVGLSQRLKLPSHLAGLDPEVSIREHRGQAAHPKTHAKYESMICRVRCDKNMML